MEITDEGKYFIRFHLKMYFNPDKGGNSCYIVDLQDLSGSL